MLIDPNPIRVVPMIGTPTITHRNRCSSNVACPAAPNNKMHKRFLVHGSMGKNQMPKKPNKKSCRTIQHVYVCVTHPGVAPLVRASARLWE